MIRTYKDLEDVPRGIFLLLSTSMVGKLKRELMRFVKLTSRKLCLVFDESDEITNPSSQRTKHILAVFRRLKYKILDTGTTTRNNIAELYSLFELLYNNSVNMTCWCSSIYHENRDKEIECERNLHCGEPFPAFRGHVLFRACHCPGKATVFGIEKQNQDVYNKDELFDLIGKTIITRNFRDFAGEKYFWPLSYSSAKTAQKRMDKLEKAGIRCKLTGYNGGCIEFLGYTPETEALLEQERQDVINAHQKWQAKQV